MNTITATTLFWTIGRGLHHKYTVGDRVRITEPSQRHGLQGVIVGRYGRLESGTNPEVENPDVIEQSWVDLLTTSP